MFDEIGTKIKGLAKSYFALELIGAVISGVWPMFTDEDRIFIGLAILLAGVLVAWASSLLIYGFGELISKACAIEKLLQKDEPAAYPEPESSVKTVPETVVPDAAIPETALPNEFIVPEKGKKGYSCPKCGSTIKDGQKVCLCSRHVDWASAKRD